ncbi:MAG: AIPR family protein [Fimbriimonadaceae bacterium]|nr:AIPR family protein [Fimbriimonadaceae bacterium]
MSDNLNEFLTDLMQGIVARTEASGELTRVAFVDELMARLVSADTLQDWVPCYYQGRGSRNRALGVDGYCMDDLLLDGSISVIVADPRLGESPVRLTTSEINTCFTQAINFVTDALEGRLHDTLEPSLPAADLARHIFDARAGVRTVRVLLVTNALVGARYKEVERQPLEGVRIERHIWDLARFEQLSAAGGREDMEIDLAPFAPGGLPVLPAGIGEAGYAAYLGVVPGAMLAQLYSDYGSRLLEGNVRAFLSTRGKINKEIRRTIIERPDRFFAFNNGITATATAVQVEGVGPATRIVRVTNLQIVNGGQTTASLYNAQLKDRAALDAVFVQMKLSVLSPQVADLMIPEISRYANTQNKVSDADLFANHSFHRKVEEISRRLWAPAKVGSRQLTHWFYERARAQYQTEYARLDKAKKREFLLQNPKEQVITKTDLAKFENSWRMLPHVVSLGAQKNFVKFAETITAAYDLQPAGFNERWFQHLVAKAILFSTAEGVVSRAKWYNHGYRANIVAYSVARLVLLVEQRFPGHVLDLDRVWKAQRVSDAVMRQLDIAGEMILGVLVAPPPPYSNVTEWAKKAQCWEKVAATPLATVDGLKSDVKSLDDEIADKNRARGQERETEAIHDMSEVVRLSKQGLWQRAAAWPSARRCLTDVEHELLALAIRMGSRFAPSATQARHLLAALRRLQDAGFTLSP